MTLTQIVKAEKIIKIIKDRYGPMTAMMRKKQIVRISMILYIRDHQEEICAQTGIKHYLLQRYYIQARLCEMADHLMCPDELMGIDDEKIPEMVEDTIKTILETGG